MLTSELRSHAAQGWELVAIGDFNRDGNPITCFTIQRHAPTVIWYMNNNVLLGAAHGPTLPGGWSSLGVADFNGDSNPDYLLFNQRHTPDS